MNLMKVYEGRLGEELLNLVKVYEGRLGGELVNLMMVYEGRGKKYIAENYCGTRIPMYVLHSKNTCQCVKFYVLETQTN